ncbi:MAG: hypothetical protein JWR00_859 [Rubritepida sp.]|nr:hypothetical protein [Rubritepida sp.]
MSGLNLDLVVALLGPAAFPVSTRRGARPRNYPRAYEASVTLRGDEGNRRVSVARIGA